MQNTRNQIVKFTPPYTANGGIKEEDDDSQRLGGA